MERETPFKRLDRGIRRHIVQSYAVTTTDFLASAVAIERIIEGDKSEARAVLVIPVLLSIVAGYHFYREGGQERGEQ